MAKATLYDLVIGERGALSELLEETDGEFTPEIEQLLGELDIKIDDKLESIGLYVLDQTGDAAKLKDEEQRLAARRKAIERGVDGLKRYAERLMLASGKEKVKSTRVTVALQKNPPAVKGELTSLELEELFDQGSSIVRLVPAALSLDRRAALELHKAGQPLPDGLTVEQGQSLRIR